MSASIPEISVIIPSFNRRDSILSLLTDLHRQQGASFETIVVDDCSTDDTVEAIGREFPEVRTIRNEKNGGPAVSRNRGMYAARGTLIVGFDSDVSIPDTTVLRRIQECFSADQSLTGVALRLLCPDAQSDDIPRWWHSLPASKGVDRVFFTNYFSGTGYAFRRQQMKEAGGYPEILYMHYEEVELAYRILDNGGRIQYRPDISVVHHAHPVATRGKIRIFYKPRNQILLAYRCYPFFKAAYYILPRLIFNLFDAIAHGHARDYIRAILSARQLIAQTPNQRRPISRKTLALMRQLRSQ